MTTAEQTKFLSDNSEILALFTATGKEIPHHDSDIGRSVSVLQVICDSQSHSIPEIGNDSSEEIEGIAFDIFEAIEEIEGNIGDSDFTLEFDGNEYRIIANNAIWEIYRDEIQTIVEDCYDLKLDDMPSFIAFEIDWEKTAVNAFVDGYGHQFSGYDGSEEEIAGYWIFRTN